MCGVNKLGQNPRVLYSNLYLWIDRSLELVISNEYFVLTTGLMVKKCMIRSGTGSSVYSLIYPYFSFTAVVCPSATVACDIKWQVLTIAHFIWNCSQEVAGSDAGEAVVCSGRRNKIA